MRRLCMPTPFLCMQQPCVCNRVPRVTPHLHFPRPACSVAMNVGGRLVTSPSDRDALVRAARTVAILGCKTEKQYLAMAGLDVIPVPVFYPEVTHILGKPVVRKVAHMTQAVDILAVFRKPSDLMAHLPDILAAPHRPKCVWLQTGIHSPEFEEALIQAGIDVVADECLMVEHQRVVGGSHSAL